MYDRDASKQDVFTLIKSTLLSCFRSDDIEFNNIILDEKLESDFAPSNP